MKGIIKGAIFSVILSAVFLTAGTFIQMYFSPDEKFFRICMWALICFSIFMGALPVSKAAAEKKAVKGIAASLLGTIIILSAFSLISGTAVNGSFYILALLCILSGVIGSFSGVK